MRKENGTLYITHCVDAEGPLCEPMDGTFDRLREVFGISLKPTAENLRKIQNKEIDFGERTDTIAKAFDPHILNYNDSWEKLDRMLIRITGDEFRNKMIDSFGNGWIYNWHCVDHVGYICNPRRRDMGIHNIFDHYRDMTKRIGSNQDGLHWHFHPMSTYQEAHRCATSFVNSPHLYEIICRRIIERNWFPSVFRAGFQAERPDSHLFLEQWIPFDISNWSSNEHQTCENYQSDVVDGRFGDWRLAPDDWSIYQPSHDNYQLPGNCRRWIGRCLDIMTRARKLTEADVEKAFVRAGQNKPTIMGITDHDVRDMAHDVDIARSLIAKVSKKHPDVKFRFCEVSDAFRLAIYGTDRPGEPVKLSVSIEGDDDTRILTVRTEKGRVFGPQPFLAIKTKSGRFIHDNFNFDTSLTSWSYTFDYDSVHANDIDSVGVATSDKYGYTFVKVIKV